MNPAPKGKQMKRPNVHRVDLTKINGNGDFPCPKYGITISPDDPTEEKYSVLYPKVNENGLEEVIVRCNSCGSHIHLSGFSLLQEIA